MLLSDPRAESPLSWVFGASLAGSGRGDGLTEVRRRCQARVAAIQATPSRPDLTCDIQSDPVFKRCGWTQ